MISGFQTWIQVVGGYYVRENNQSDKNLKENVDDYIYENQDIRCSRLDWWENVMFKQLRCDEHILLYSKFLQKWPMCIPWKLQNGKLYAINE